MRARRSPRRGASGAPASGERIGTALATWALATAMLGCAGAATSAERSPPSAPAATEIPAACRDATAWHPALREEADAAAVAALAVFQAHGGTIPTERAAALHKALRGELQWRIVRNLLLGARLHNAGAVTLAGARDASGQPLRVFRTGFTDAPGAPGSCLAALLDQGGVRHIVNLYAGPMPTQDLEDAERQAVTARGGTYLNARDVPAMSGWRESLHDGGDRAAAMQAVAAIIRGGVLRPQGAPPRGAVQIHCGGGMHRTGMVVGVLQRCLGGASPAAVEAAYKHHVAYRDADAPGGFEQPNLDFILQFDCGLLRTP